MRRTGRRISAALLGAAWLALTAGVGAAQQDQSPPQEQSAEAARGKAATGRTSDAARAGADAFVAESRHSFTAGTGAAFDYVARTGTLTVPADEDAERRGRMFFVSYARADADPARRPVTFVFNGGPGAAAAYLHMGAMGPMRLAFADDGQVTERPRVVDNAESWLAFTDLVFVDPVGTGFSRAVGGKDDGKGKDGKRKGGGDASAFWETGRDLDTLAQFIRLWLTRHGRWLSPVALAGESYGGFRAAALADRLHGRFGIAARGVVMISPALELGLLSGDRFRLMPWIASVPSYAAAARRHGKAASGGEGPDAQAQEATERFAVDTLLPGLARGRAMPAQARNAMLARLAALTGLPAGLVTRYGGKIPSHVFAAKLLEGQGKRLSSYDASIAFPAPHPAEGGGGDPRLARVSAAIAAAFNHEIRSRLGVKTDLPYEVLNRRISARWEWQQGRGRGGAPGATENLEAALREVPGLRALVAHGRYDLVTPYFGSRYLIDQIALDAAQAGRLVLRVYEGGHMFYSHADARRAFFEDARRMYAAMAADAPEAPPPKGDGGR